MRMVFLIAALGCSALGAQTPADAKANGAFRDGYHTTTMQDCCKPTCAWADWTVGYKLPVDGEWNSFYSCDKNGKPITK